MLQIITESLHRQARSYQEKADKLELAVVLLYAEQERISAKLPVPGRALWVILMSRIRNRMQFGLLRKQSRDTTIKWTEELYMKQHGRYSK